MSKYAPLNAYLDTTNQDKIAMTFGDVERVLGFALPPSARTHRPWWANDPTGKHVQAKAWQEAGYGSAEVDLEAERLLFVRLNAAPAAKAALAGRHPMFGAMKDMMLIMPGVDLTAPSDLPWGADEDSYLVNTGQDR